MAFLNIRKRVFYPLTLTMRTEDILFGTMSLGQRWQYHIGLHPTLSSVWIEVTALPNPDLIAAIQELNEQQSLVWDGIVLAVRCSDDFSGPDESLLMQQIDQSEEIRYDGPLDLITSLQYLIDHNAGQLIRDGEAGNDATRGPAGQLSPSFLADPVSGYDHAFIDESNGPVLISKDATILPGARMMGPLAVLPKAVIKMGAELYPGSTIGPGAVVNGEVKNSIIHDFSAKSHAGYLGDSLMGRWNNFGAGTTVSNVSNTFSKVRIQDWISGEEIEYDTIKRGVVTGDFVKLGILSKVYRGTAIGSFSSISTSGVISGNIPALTWWTEEGQSPYQTGALRKHCQRQMSLRGQLWSGEWDDRVDAMTTGLSGDSLKYSE